MNITRPMNITIQPFFSQQDKVHELFLLDADVTVRISKFLAEQLSINHSVTLILPAERQCHSYPTWTEKFKVRPFYTPLNNVHQRLTFNPELWASALDNCDLLITHNELMAARLRPVFQGRIVHFNHLMPLGPWEWMKGLQQASWDAADLTVFLSDQLRVYASNSPMRKSTVWPMVYDADCIRQSVRKDVDVLFVQRCSASNYTHHLEFIEAMHGFSGRVVFTDPTHYLEKVAGEQFNYAHCTSPESYYDLLGRSRVAVALMTDDMHGGVAIREAIVSGCVPVLLDVPCYRMLHPPLLTTLAGIRQAVELALCGADTSRVVSTVKQESFQNAWPTVEQELEVLCGSQR